MVCPALIQSQIFFFISSIGFIVLFILLIIIFVRLAHVLKTFSRMSDKLEKNVENIGDSAEEMVEDIRDSVVYRFMFGKKKKKIKK